MLSKNDPRQFEPIEQVREQLLKDDREISLQGFGAGSKHFSNTQRKINAIAKTSLTPSKYARLYASITDHFESNVIVELGTSFGVNTAYLAQKKNTHIATFEGELEIANIARTTFKSLLVPNIELIVGNIDQTLPTYLNTIQTVDLAFMDANHQLAPTLQYFNAIVKKVNPKSMVILDDIHQSAGMEKAWKEIKSHPLVYCSIDLYRCGIVFFDPSLNKQHVVLQF